MNIPVISLDAHWHDAKSTALPAQLAPWILEPASLTARLKRHCDTFRVQVLNEQRTVLPAFLQTLLPATEYAQLREVVLWCNDMPCVYGQSWLPQHTINVLKPLADMGERPLGDYIFQQKGLRRGVIEVTQQQLTLPETGTVTCYTRRSVFQLDNLPLLVAEAFLPAVTQLKVSN